MPAVTSRSSASPPPLKAATFKARFWDRFALGYAGGAIGDWAGYERSLARTRELLGPGASVLEIGCGTGSTALTLSLFTGPYRATDIAPQMIAVARQRLAASPRPNLRFVVEDADATASEAAGPFDAVLAFNLLHLVADLDRHFFSIGFGRKGEHLDFDLAYQFGYGPTRTVSGSNVNPQTGESVDGRYEFFSHALMATIGWRF